MRKVFLLLSLVLCGCATVDSVKSWINRKEVTEQAIISAQEDVNAAAEVGAEIYASQQYSEARSFLMTARQMKEDGNYDTAQEMASRASASAKKAKDAAEEEKKNRQNKTKKGRSW